MKTIFHAFLLFCLVNTSFGYYMQGTTHLTIYNVSGSTVSSQITYNQGANQGSFVFNNLANGASVSGDLTTVIGLSPSDFSTVTFYLACGGDIWSLQIAANTWSAEGQVFNLTGYIFPGCQWSSTNLPCSTNLSFSVNNNNPDWRMIGAGKSLETASSNMKMIPPGGNYSITVQVPCDEASQWKIWASSIGGDELTPTDLGPTGNGNTNSPPTVTPPANSNVGNQTNFITATPTKGVPQSNILWSAGSNTGDTAGVANSVKDAASVAHDDATKIGEQTHQDLGRIYTNTLGMTNFATETTLKGFTNLFSNALTNGEPGGLYSNKLSFIAGLIPSSSTNKEAAETAAAAAQGDYGVQGIIDQLNPIIPGPATAPDMVVHLDFGISSYDMDLDPNHHWPEVSNAALIGWRIVLLLAFFAEIGRMFWKLIQIRASTQTGGVPNLNVEVMAEVLGCGGAFGSNILGMTVALIVPVIFISMFVALMIYLFANLGVTLADAMNLTNFTNSLGSVGYYLLSSFFPVTLSFSLVCTRLVLTFTLGKLLALATAASRFLWGK